MVFAAAGAGVVLGAETVSNGVTKSSNAASHNGAASASATPSRSDLPTVGGAAEAGAASSGLNFLIMGDWGGLPDPVWDTPAEKATAKAMATEGECADEWVGSVGHSSHAPGRSSTALCVEGGHRAWLCTELVCCAQVVGLVSVLPLRV